MARVTPADLSTWLVAYTRRQLAALRLPHTVDVSDKEPPDLSAASSALVVLRTDLGRKLSAVSFDTSVGVSVLAGTRQHDQPANDLVRHVYGVLTDDEIASVPNSPIAAVVLDGTRGPFPVEEPQDKARRYFTVQYVTVGTW